MAAVSAHPVRTLREQVTALEAAITLTLANPKRKPVHRLRTMTRRIEAQLELLSLLPNLPSHSKPAKKSGKLLRIFRRAAGLVRDLDVQRDLTPSKSSEGRRLRNIFRHQRDKKVKSLLDAIEKHQSKLIRALERLLETLEPAESFALSATHLAELTLHWYAHNTPTAADQDQRQLHDIRKAAKLARYIAESISSDPKVSTATLRLARTFESLQQSGGDWHDWLTLSGIAHRELGSSSPLTRSFARHCEESLASYQHRLKSLPKKLSGTPISKGLPKNFGIQVQGAYPLFKAAI